MSRGVKVSGSLDVVEVSGSLGLVSLSMFTQALLYNYLLIIILYCCYDFHRICRCSDGYFNLTLDTAIQYIVDFGYCNTIY
jgi:hypothetical protein